MTCPSFIAAPFIVPRAATICSAASRLRRSSAACLPSSPRPRLAARRAQMARRLAGGEARHPRGPGDARGRDPVLGHGYGVAVGVGRCSARSSASAWPSGVAVSVAVGVGGRRGRRVSDRPSVALGVAVGLAVGVGVAAGAEERRSVPLSLVAGPPNTQLGAGYEDDSEDERTQGR